MDIYNIVGFLKFYLQKSNVKICNINVPLIDYCENKLVCFSVALFEKDLDDIDNPAIKTSLFIYPDLNKIYINCNKEQSEIECVLTKSDTLLIQEQSFTVIPE